MAGRKLDIAIIIPIYNAEKYLARCVESVIKALDNYDGDGEILLIDNNSKDNSPKIAKDFERKYPQIVKCYKCTTPGAGAARNYAVPKVNARYFWFVDADDEISVDSIQKLMYEADRTKADFIMLGLVKVYPDGHREKIPAFSPQKADFKSRFIRSELGPVQVLIKKAWYEKNEFKFMEGRIHEDMEMMPALMLYTDNISAINEPLYIYYQNPDSTLHKLEWDEHYYDIFPALEGLYARFNKAGATGKYHDELEWFFIWNLLMDSAEYYGKFSEGRAGLKKSRAMLKEYFPHWYKNKFLKNTNLKTRTKIILNYLKV